eukprot:TRINITY_DN4449_c0_g1_i1.p1 TRINITY_DN4449_c0_g1~~TRINITY_DN4449_c0_g1_i1.p1  ORF type:complete len:444 (-),score=157.58 TRINITY_DN4449_c0_g1_i1:32-1321(-)
MGRRSGSRVDEGYRIETLNRLAFPKGQNPICELTGQPATIQCVTPHVTLYYATREHAEQAWHGIMRRISPLVGPLRNPAPIIGSKEERERKALVVEMSKKALVDLCQQEASKFLTQGNYELAVPGAIQALAFAQDAYGAQSLEMVPAYLLLSQANLGLARLQSAEEFLSLANWVVLRNPDCSSAVRSQLHQNFGKLYRAQGKLDKALQELSSHVYCSSVEVGPEHISTSAGYFLMADVFYTQRKVNTALAFYDKVVDIWYKLLASMCHGSADEVPEEQLAEGLEMLLQVLSMRLNLLGEGHMATGEAKYTLGLLHMFMGEQGLAREQLEGALQVYITNLGEDHPSTLDVQNILQQATQATPEGGFAGGDAIPAPADQRQTLMSGFTSLQHTTRAATQSPIPLPPVSQGMASVAEDDAMLMSPPHTASSS